MWTTTSKTPESGSKWEPVGELILTWKTEQRSVGHGIEWLGWYSAKVVCTGLLYFTWAPGNRTGFPAVWCCGCRQEVWGCSCSFAF